MATCKENLRRMGYINFLGVLVLLLQKVDCKPFDFSSDTTGSAISRNITFQTVNRTVREAPISFEEVLDREVYEDSYPVTFHVNIRSAINVDFLNGILDSPLHNVSGRFGERRKTLANILSQLQNKIIGMSKTGEPNNLDYDDYDYRSRMDVLGHLKTLSNRTGQQLAMFTENLGENLNLLKRIPHYKKDEFENASYALTPDEQSDLEFILWTTIQGLQNTINECQRGLIPFDALGYESLSDRLSGLWLRLGLYPEWELVFQSSNVTSYSSLPIAECSFQGAKTLHLKINLPIRRPNIDWKLHRVSKLVPFAFNKQVCIADVSENVVIVENSKNETFFIENFGLHNCDIQNPNNKLCLVSSIPQVKLNRMKSCLLQNLYNGSNMNFLESCDISCNDKIPATARLENNEFSIANADAVQIRCMFPYFFGRDLGPTPAIGSLKVPIVCGCNYTIVWNNQTTFFKPALSLCFGEHFGPEYFYYSTPFSESFSSSISIWVLVVTILVILFVVMGILFVFCYFRFCKSRNFSPNVRMKKIIT